jgi:probable HAF family extracellular repeat protein
MLLALAGASPVAADIGATEARADIVTIPVNTSCGIVTTTIVGARGDIVGQCEDPQRQHLVLWSGRYDTPVDLGLASGAAPRDINRFDRVIGWYGREDGAAFLWDEGTVTYLAYPSHQVWVEGINDHDQVVGSLTPTAGPGSQAFAWEHGAFAIRPTPAGWSSFASSINNHGQVLGSLVNADWSTTRAVLWDRGEMVDLGTLGGSSTLVGVINDRGQIMANSQTSTGDYHPVLWEHGRIVDLLAGTGAETGFATAINDTGLIVGFANFRAAAWYAGQMRYLSPPEAYGQASAVNNRGDIAGTICPLDIGCDRQTQVFLWHGATVTYIDAPAGGSVDVGALDIHGRMFGSVTSGIGMRELAVWIIH